jgi:hypothetical protein
VCSGSTLNNKALPPSGKAAAQPTAHAVAEGARSLGATASAQGRQALHPQPTAAAVWLEHCERD